MDYQCIVVYTIVKIAPLNSSQPEESTSAGNSNKSTNCLEWVKLQIKRFECYF